MISVNADVIDLRSDAPRQGDSFFVDTNVWYWMGYTKASQSAKNYQVNEYPNYLGNALTAGSQLYVCTLSFAELAHIIERDEREIFNKSNSTAIGTKQFRHDYPAERSNVITEIENVWSIADSMANGNALEVDLTKLMVSNSITRLKSEALDGYDVFMIETLISQQINQVITDDMDFGTVSGITVFTANNTLISEARTQGKLKKR